MPRLVNLALASALALSSSAAFAASSASATLGNFRIQLIDLDPTDGITPSYSFNSSGRTTLGLATSDGYAGESDSLSRTRNGTFAFTHAFESDLANVQAASSISSTTLQASGAAFGSNTTFSANASTGRLSDYYYDGLGGLTLSGRTLAVISMDAAVSASASNGPSCASYYYYCQSTEVASASAQLSLTYSYSDAYGSASYNFRDSLSASARAVNGGSYWGFQGYDSSGYPIYGYTVVEAADASEAQSRKLTVVFTNSTAVSQFGSLYLSASVNGQATGPLATVTAAPVPEPQTYALMAAGLGVVGWMARRRRA